jgi:small subunit ribosomal protein S5e
MAEETAVVEYANKPALFGRWTYDDVKITDPCFKDYIALSSVRA